MNIEMQKKHVYIMIFAINCWIILIHSADLINKLLLIQYLLKSFLLHIIMKCNFFRVHWIFQVRPGSIAQVLLLQIFIETAVKMVLELISELTGFSQVFPGWILGNVSRNDSESTWGSTEDRPGSTGIDWEWPGTTGIDRLGFPLQTFIESAVHL